MSDSASDLDALMRKALSGDKASYNALLRGITPVVRGFLYKRMAVAADVEDVLQEILISVHRSLHTHDGRRAALPWVMAIAHYRLTDYLRRQYRIMAREKVDYDSIASQLADPNSDVTFLGSENELLHNALAALPERQRDIVTRLKLEGNSVKEVAKLLDMSESAVKVAAHRAYKLLKQNMQAEEKQ